MKTFNSLLAASALVATVNAEADKTISFAGKIADFTFDVSDTLQQNITLSLDETSQCDLKYKALPWSVECSLGLSLNTEGLLDMDEVTFRASIGGRIDSTDVEGSDGETEQTMTFFYSASTPEFTFGSAWEQFGVPTIEAKTFPTGGGNFELNLPATKLSEGYCVSDVKEHLEDAGITNEVMITAAEVIEGASEIAGNDLCAKVHGLTIDEQAMGASVQLIVQIDLLNENKIDFDKWGLPGFNANSFATYRRSLLGMDRPYSQTINVGAEIYKLIKARIEEEQAAGRRSLEDSPDSYMDANGNFYMGAYNEDSTNGASAQAASMLAMLLVMLVTLLA